MLSRLPNQSFIVCTVSVTLLKLSTFALTSPPPGSLSLAWDPSPDPRVAGYRLYLGGISQTYTNLTDVGNKTSITILNLIPGATYYFAVTAYDSHGSESAFSGEIAYTVPPIGSLPETSVLCGTLKREALNQMTFSGRGLPGRVYDVFATQDLLSWLVIGTIIVDASGAFKFTDPLSGVLPVRYYRLHEHGSQ